MSTRVKWVSVDERERLPDDGVKVLVLCSDDCVRYGYLGLKGWRAYSKHKNECNMLLSKKRNMVCFRGETK